MASLLRGVFSIFEGSEIGHFGGLGGPGGRSLGVPQQTSAKTWPKNALLTKTLLKHIKTVLKHIKTDPIKTY